MTTLGLAVWTSTVGWFWSQYAGDETIYLIAGRARITDQDDRSAIYRAGQVILIRAGSRCTWEIEEPVRMLFPLPRRGRRRQGEVMRRGTEAVDRLQGPVVPVTSASPTTIRSTTRRCAATSTGSASSGSPSSC